MKQIFTSILCLLATLSATAQVNFTNSTSLLSNSNINSGAAMGVADVNGDGLDDIIRFENASDLNIGYQQSDGSQFVAYWNGNVGSGSEWGMCVGDVDEDGYNDILMGGAYNHLKMHLMGPNGVASSYWMPNPNIFLQGVNMADITNDGWSDVFACHDDGVAAPFRNDGNNNWTYDLGLINTASTIPSDNSGNYGSVWTDYDSDGDLDLYISKCRGGVSNPLDGRRTNLLFENDGSNNYSEVAEARGLRPLGQSWSADFADIDNDGDMDCFVINHDIPSILYENQGDTLWVNINASAGLTALFNSWSAGIQVVMDDFDNDGFNDIILTGGDGLLFLINDGDKTFTNTSAFPSSASDMHSLAVGDLNADGSLDLVAGFANGYNSPSSKEDILYMNDGNTNHWIKAALTGQVSNINGIGARATIYGSWGVQIREVRSGEGYGIQNTFDLHFGLGANSTVDSLVILWPSGIRDVIWNPAPDVRHEILEGCHPYGNSSLLATSTEICDGEELEFGDLTIDASGVYVQQFTSASGCDSSVELSVTVLPVDAVQIDLSSCNLADVGTVIETFTNQHGCDSVVTTVTTLDPSPDAAVTQTGNMLTAVAGYSYQWIDCGKDNMPVEGETGQSFTPLEDGSYAVIVDNGTCQATSECTDIIGLTVFEGLFPFEVKVYPNPVFDLVQIEFSTVVRNAQIVLHNIYGAAILTRKLDTSSGVRLDMSALPAGNYLLEVRHEGKAGTVRLVKH